MTLPAVGGNLCNAPPWDSCASATLRSQAAKSGKQELHLVIGAGSSPESCKAAAEVQILSQSWTNLHCFNRCSTLLNLPLQASLSYNSSARIAGVAIDCKTAIYTDAFKLDLQYMSQKKKLNGQMWVLGSECHEQYEDFLII